MCIRDSDKPGIGRNSPPASSGDNLAPDWLIDYMNRKDENLLQIQDRLKRVEAQTNNDVLIAGGKKSDEQRAYEDFVRDSGSQPLDEQLMDMDKGRMGGGLDILDDLLFNDTV